MGRRKKNIELVDEAPANVIYVVAPGKSILNIRGILTEGTIVTAESMRIDEIRFKQLIERSIIIESA